MRFIFPLLSFLFLDTLGAQNIDIQHYRFQLQLSDETDRVAGRAQVILKYVQGAQQLSLDLVQERNGKGMKADSIRGRNVAGFKQENDRLLISLKSAASAGAIDTIEIVYGGIPRDGLVISKNKFGD